MGVLTSDYLGENSGDKKGRFFLNPDTDEVRMLRAARVT